MNPRLVPYFSDCNQVRLSGAFSTRPVKGMIMSIEVKIEGGLAVHMGDGAFALLQDGDDGPQLVTVTVDDLRRVLEALG